MFRYCPSIIVQGVDLGVVVIVNGCHVRARCSFPTVCVRQFQRNEDVSSPSTREGLIYDLVRVLVTCI